MLTSGQILWLLIDCKIVTISILWLAIMETIKWFSDKRDDVKKETIISDEQV